MRPMLFPIALPAASAVAAAAPCDAARRDAWDRARSPELSRYCDLLAQAEASVEADPKRAATAAGTADQLLPGRAAPLVLLARAAAAEGRASDAVALFRRARALDPEAGRDASALFALATSLAQSSDEKGAVAAYRALVPQASALGAARRTQARVDAGLAILREGPDAAAEAISVLRAAVSGAAPELASLADAALALALDRTGARGEARALLAGSRSVAIVGRGAEGASPRVARREDALALRALANESADVPRAIADWEAFLAAAGQSPWSGHARAHLSELRRVPGKGGRR